MSKIFCFICVLTLVISSLIYHIVENDKQIVELYKQIVEKDNQIVEKDNQIVETDNLIVEKDEKANQFVEQALELYKQMVEKDNQIVKQDNRSVELDKLLKDPHYGNNIAYEEFKRAEIWRKELFDTLYKDMTDEDWNTAKRWKSYAEPFADWRSCENVEISNIDILEGKKKLDNKINLKEENRKHLLAIHIFHSTGIDGNTLTLTETQKIIDGKKLFADFPDEWASSTTGPSIIEVKDLKYVMDDLKLISLPNKGFISNKFKNITQESLIDINSIIIKDLGKPIGLRRHPVIVTYRKILLPMPDELPYLLKEYIDWLNKKLADYQNLEMNLDSLNKILSLSCDAHTHYEHIHPFADGDGRLGRVISAIVLQRFGLPGPIFLKEERWIYMNAVSASLINNEYSDLCILHAKAVLRSVNYLLDFST